MSFRGEALVRQLDRPSLAGKDCAYYLDKAPGAMAMVGARNEERGIVHPLHHPSFDLNERALTLGAKLFVQLVADLQPNE